MLTLFFFLMAGHCLADYALQTDTMGREKRRSSETELQKIVPWYYWLTAHAFIHGLVVALITNVYFGIMETVAHWIIDFGKCEGWYGLKVDQTLHFLCKLFYFSCIVAFSYALN